MDQLANNDSPAHELKHKLWLNSWWVSFIVFALGWLYELVFYKSINLIVLAEALAITGAVLIAISFALSGFSYYFNFLDNKLGYRKYLGVVGFFYALAHALTLVVIYPDKYGWGLVSRLSETEVILGLVAITIYLGMIVISNVKVINQALGTKHWRQGLRFGYLAMILLAIRAYIMESDLWFTWLETHQTLPPSSLVMSFISIWVIILRGSMIVSMQVRARANNNHNHYQVSGQGIIKVLLIFITVVAASILFFSYQYLTVRPVLAPTSPEIQSEVNDYDQSPPDEITEPSVKPQTDSELSFLNLPDGFVIQIFASKLAPSLLSKPGPGVGPRLMTVVGEAVYVAVPGEGKILVLKDTNGDGRADWQQEFFSGLKRPHNIVQYDGWYYIAAEDQILRVQDRDNDLKAEAETVEKLVSLPTGGHWTRTVKIINRQLYIAVGSSCNVCNETDKQRAAITRCDLNGKNCTVFASGLRNTVDFVEHQGAIYGTDNGRDQLGNTLPPEEINKLVAGGNYGWPICYGQQLHDTNFDKNVYIRDPCADTIAPAVELPAHNAPLGLAFYQGEEFPPDYQGDLFVAAHGSWNRQPPDGYKVFRIDWQTKKVSDFITGWLSGTTVRGRPVGVVNYQGGLLVSDDAGGIIYFVRYSP